MIFRVLLCLIFFFIGATSSYSQYTNEILKDYWLPDINRKYLSFDGDLSALNDNTRLSSGSINGNNRSENYITSLRIGYGHYINKPDLQREVNLRANFHGQILQRNRNEQSNEKTSNYSPNLSYNWINRRYNVKTNEFFETDIIANSSFSYYGVKRPSSSSSAPSIIKDGTIDFSTPIKIGKGRIQPIQDVRHAIFILEKLSALGKLNRNLSKEEVQAFAQLISTIKNKRFFDTRLQRIYEIEKIDAFLQERGIAMDTDATYYANLTDMWDFGGLQIRNTGTRFAFAFVPGYYLGKAIGKKNGSVSKESNMHAWNLKAGIEFQKEKPKNTKWQNNIYSSIYIGRSEGGNQFKNNSGVGKFFGHAFFDARVRQTRGYYPSTRTDINASYGAEYINFWEPKLDFKNASKILSLNFGLNFNFYISPQFRLNVNSNLKTRLYSSRYSSDFLYISNDNRQIEDYFRKYHLGFENSFSKNYRHNSQIRLLYSWF